MRLRLWVRSKLFLTYLRRFVLLWIAGKVLNAVTARTVDLPPFAFRTGTELVILAFELGVIVVFIKRANEDILLGNLGMGLAAVLAPLAFLHVFLSGLLALFA